MYKNAIYTCISWYSKICWFPVKICWCQWNSWCVTWFIYNRKSHRSRSVKKVFLRVPQNSQKVFHKNQTLAQVLFCEFCGTTSWNISGGCIKILPSINSEFCQSLSSKTLQRHRFYSLISLQTLFLSVYNLTVPDNKIMQALSDLCNLF